MKVTVYKPGCASRRTVFENQLLLYEYLQKTRNLNFDIIVDESEYEEDSRFQWHPIPSRTWQSFRGRRFFWRKSSKKKVLSALFSESKLIVTLDPTVYPQAHLAFEIASEMSIPIWIDMTITLRTENLFNRWNRRAKRLVLSNLEQCERINIPTPKVLERLFHLNLLTERVLSRCHILGHAIDSENFRPPVTRSDIKKQPFTFLCVSRLTVEKGIPYILEAFLNALEQGIKARLIFCGTGLLENYIRKCLPQKHATAVLVAKPVEHAQLIEVYNQADAFVSHALELPTWEEYFGVTNLEAMSCGLPVIAAATGAQPFVLRGQSKPHWIAPGNVNALTNKFLDIYSESIHELEIEGKQNRNYVISTYSLESVANRWNAPIART